MILVKGVVLIFDSKYKIYRARTVVNILLCFFSYRTDWRAGLTEERALCLEQIFVRFLCSSTRLSLGYLRILADGAQFWRKAIDGYEIKGLLHRSTLLTSLNFPHHVPVLPMIPRLKRRHLTLPLTHKKTR